jgi:MFS family permease
VQLKEGENPSLILYKYRWVVLCSFFFTSCSTGVLTGSLSTNRGIIDKLEENLDRDQLQIAKYADMVLYFPLNFASIWIIENYGLKLCISIGSLIMIAGSALRFLSIFGTLYIWFAGHILCACSQAFLKNPVSKLASNWFGDKERSLATSIGLVSTPLGIFISQILIVIIFRTDDELEVDSGGPEVDETRARFNLYMSIIAIMTICFCLPAIFLIREKPPSPPSMVATKPRPVQTFREAFGGLIRNPNYIQVFLYFQCVNTVSIYNSEIDAYFGLYALNINE